MSQKDNKSGAQRKKALMYSEEFQEMLDRLEEEDYVDIRSEEGVMGMRKNRLCIEKVKELERHFEEDNKLQPERKMKIAEQVELEPRQVAIWFQNRRARSKTKHLEMEYDHLRASYDALVNDYGSLEQEKLALLGQLKELKAKIDARNIESNNQTPSSTHCTNVSVDNTSVTVPFSMLSTSSTRFDPTSMSSSSVSDEFRVCKSYQEHLMRMEELGMLNNSDASCNFFSSVDQAPTLHYWQYGTNEFN